MNLGKFFRSLFHGVNPAEMVAALARERLIDEGLPAVTWLKRAAVLTVAGRRYVVDVCIREEQTGG